MMTEAELWHMHLLAVENTSAGLEGVSTIIFGYLAATYLIGAKLSRFQATLLTVFFVIVAGLSEFFSFVEYRRAIYFMRKLTADYGISSISPNDAILPIFAVALAMLIPACVYFMYQVRSASGSGAESP